MGLGKLKIAGAWAGVLEVDLDEWTVGMLREEVARRLGGADGSSGLKLICAGRLLKDCDGAEKLSQLGVKNNAKVLVSVDRGKSLKEEFLAEEERANRLARLKAAATSLARRHVDGSLPVDDFNLELENQSGEKVQLGTETDQRAIMMGLMLHANGKALMKQQKFKDALEVLNMGEEAFSLCDMKVLEMVDNVSILQVDMVWCYFMLRDISWLSVAGTRLAKARQGIERAHGKESSRLRILQTGRFPEIALYLRLELLEGVVAYHSGQLEKSKEALTSAQAKYFQLQVSDEALSLLMSMGYKEKEAKRALRMSNQDVGSAVEFLVEEKAKKAQKREEDRRRQKEIWEQKRYGVTPNKKAVDLQKLNELVSTGFVKELAAEALRRNENDIQKALDDLTNPETNSAMQVYIESRKRKKSLRSAATVTEDLVSMGFSRAAVVAAVQMFGNKEQALDYLVGQPHENTANVMSENPSVSLPQTVDMNAGGVADGGGSSAEEFDEGPHDEFLERDFEMEDELTGELAKADAYTDYDIELTKEGEAISEYLALSSSTGSSSK